VSAATLLRRLCSDRRGRSDNTTAVRQLSEDEGYTCAEMEDGRELLDIALQCHPRLGSDLMMPEVDGFTAAEQLRSHPGTQDILIHCLTALDFPAARRRRRALRRRRLPHEALRRGGAPGRRPHRPAWGHISLKDARADVPKLHSGDDSAALGYAARPM